MRAPSPPWQPRVALPESLWCQVAPPLSVYCPLWSFRFSIHTDSEPGSPYQLCGPCKNHLSPLGVSCLILLTGIIRGRKRVSRQWKTLNVRGSREALGKWKWPLCDHLAGGRCARVGVHKAVTGLGRPLGEGEALWLATVAASPRGSEGARWPRPPGGAGCRAWKERSVHSLAESCRRQAGDTEDLSVG